MKQERVYTITDYYDGPIRGIANYHGAPHLYSAIFDDGNDEYSNEYLLMEIDEDTLSKALERWEIWLRWSKAFDEGRTTQQTHPALPEDRARHEKLEAILKHRLRMDTTRARRAIGRFETPKGPGWSNYVVTWSESAL